jgi:hypothetical protein
VKQTDTAILPVWAGFMCPSATKAADFVTWQSERPTSKNERTTRELVFA